MCQLSPDSVAQSLNATVWACDMAVRLCWGGNEVGVAAVAVLVVVFPG